MASIAHRHHHADSSNLKAALVAGLGLLLLALTII
jgi:hypothetical protein